MRRILFEFVALVIMFVTTGIVYRAYRHHQIGQAVRELKAIGPPPWDEGRKEGVHTKWATSFEPSQPSFREGVSRCCSSRPMARSTSLILHAACQQR
jgi:hypothetical protein